MTPKNPEVDETGKQIGWLYCTPEEWEVNDDLEHCPKCDAVLRMVSGWDEDCNDYKYHYCGVCGWESKP